MLREAEIIRRFKRREVVREVKMFFFQELSVTRLYFLLFTKIQLG